MVVTKKVVLLGDCAVGKTSLIRRFVHDRFDDSYIVTIGSKVSKKVMKIEKGEQETALNLMVWDVLGREGYRAVHTRTFAGVHGAILVADQTRAETMDTLERYWIPTLFEVVEYAPLVFAANKSDLKERAFESNALAAIASRYNIGLEETLPPGSATTYATSAKTGDNVNRLFESLGRMMLSERAGTDPVREIFEDVVAKGVQRHADRSTRIGALDAIIADFCETFADDNLAMILIRLEVVRAGIDVRHPSNDGMQRLVEYMAEAESEYLDHAKVAANRERRMHWAKEAI